jgi:hypothetical protein
LRLGARCRTLFRWCADIMMMAAALAFTFQGTFIAQAATGANSHYHHGYNQQHAAHQHAKSHVVAHVHKDGTIHRHAVDDGNRALKDHTQQPGCPCCWNMAVIAAVLPLPPVSKFDVALRSRVAIGNLDPYRSTEPDGPRRPPRPPSIA